MLIVVEKEGQDVLNEMSARVTGQRLYCKVLWQFKLHQNTFLSRVCIYTNMFFSEIKSHSGSPEDLVSVDPSCQAELILCELGSNLQYVHGYLSHCVLLSE